MAECSAASSIRVDVRSLPSASQEPLHLLPCEIQKEGAASVREYFGPAVKQGEAGKEVSFRGRVLRGQDVFIPSGFMGVVLKENNRPCTDDEDRSLSVRSTFNSFTQWNLETPPSADDVLVMSLAWPKIASAIHAPVD